MKHMIRMAMCAVMIASAVPVFAGDFDNLDYSSLSAMDASMLSLIRDIPVEEREAFSQGFMVVQSEVERKIATAPKALEEQEVLELVRDILRNKSIDGIIELGQ